MADRIIETNFNRTLLQFINLGNIRQSLRTKAMFVTPTGNFPLEAAIGEDNTLDVTIDGVHFTVKATGPDYAINPQYIEVVLGGVGYTFEARWFESNLQIFPIKEMPLAA